MAKKKSRKIPEINAGSMADIAFLLLVFFLVTTTIQTDAGVNTILPPYIPPDAEIPPVKVERRNVYDVLVNANDQVLIRSTQLPLEQVKTDLRAFILNRGADPTRSESPEEVVISIQNDKGTSYKTYLHVYNEIQAAYNLVWNEEAQSAYGTTWDKLTEDKQAEIKKKFPMLVSEAEPSDFGAGQ